MPCYAAWRDGECHEGCGRPRGDRVGWAEAYIDALRLLAPRYGFGFVDGWHKIGRRFWPGLQAAAYLSSYFAGGRGRKMAITENVLAGDLPRLVVSVSRDLTSQSGCTMKSEDRAAALGCASRSGRLPEAHTSGVADGRGDAQPADRVRERSRW